MDADDDGGSDHYMVEAYQQTITNIVALALDTHMPDYEVPALLLLLLDCCSSLAPPLRLAGPRFLSRGLSRALSLSLSRTLGRVHVWTFALCFAHARTHTRAHTHTLLRSLSLARSVR
eukprot:432404-Rhodomonas_salina.2